MDFVCVGGWLLGVFLRLAVSSRAVLVYLVQTTFISSSNDVFCFYFTLLPEIPPRHTCAGEREGN